MSTFKRTLKAEGFYKGTPAMIKRSMVMEKYRRSIENSINTPLFDPEMEERLIEADIDNPQFVAEFYRRSLDENGKQSCSCKMECAQTCNEHCKCKPDLKRHLQTTNNFKYNNKEEPRNEEMENYEGEKEVRKFIPHPHSHYHGHYRHWRHHKPHKTVNNHPDKHDNINNEHGQASNNVSSGRSSGSDFQWNEKDSTDVGNSSLPKSHEKTQENSDTKGSSAIEIQGENEGKILKDRNGFDLLTMEAIANTFQAKNEDINNGKNKSEKNQGEVDNGGNFNGDKTATTDQDTNNLEYGNSKNSKQEHTDRANKTQENDIKNEHFKSQKNKTKLFDQFFANLESFKTESLFPETHELDNNNATNSSGTDQETFAQDTGLASNSGNNETAFNNTKDIEQSAGVQTNNSYPGNNLTQDNPGKNDTRFENSFEKSSSEEQTPEASPETDLIQDKFPGKDHLKEMMNLNKLNNSSKGLEQARFDFLEKMIKSYQYYRNKQNQLLKLQKKHLKLKKQKHFLQQLLVSKTKALKHDENNSLLDSPNDVHKPTSKQFRSSKAGHVITEKIAQQLERVRLQQEQIIAAQLLLELQIKNQHDYFGKMNNAVENASQDVQFVQDTEGKVPDYVMGAFTDEPKKTLEDAKKKILELKRQQHIKKLVNEQEMKDQELLTPDEMSALEANHRNQPSQEYETNDNYSNQDEPTTNYQGNQVTKTSQDYYGNQDDSTVNFHDNRGDGLASRDNYGNRDNSMMDYHGNQEAFYDAGISNDGNDGQIIRQYQDMRNNNMIQDYSDDNNPDDVSNDYRMFR